LETGMEDIRHELVVAESGQPGLKFVARVQEKTADPFFQWLRDEKSVPIDWSAFGVGKLKSESND
jgi:hypothetical protein